MSKFAKPALEDETPRFKPEIVKEPDVWAVNPSGRVVAMSANEPFALWLMGKENPKEMESTVRGWRLASEEEEAAAKDAYKADGEKYQAISEKEQAQRRAKRPKP